MVDKVELKGMEFFGYHGCMKEERAIGQRFLFKPGQLVSAY